MIDPFYADAVFFFAAERCNGAFQKFCSRFFLTISSVHDVFEIVDNETGRVLHEEAELSAILSYLDLNPDCGFDFYLVDKKGLIFTFSYLRDGYHVMSLPYGLFDQDSLSEIIGDFDAIYGWGAGEDSSPPENLDDIRAAVGSKHSPFLRYRNGEFVLPNEFLD